MRRASWPRAASDAAETLAAVLPKRLEDVVRPVPDAPKKLLALLQLAIGEGTVNWATGSDAVAALLSPKIQYTDLRGEVAQGKQAALESMDRGMERLLSRISKSTRSGKKDHVQVRGDGPAPGGAAGSFVVIITFRLYLLVVRMKETYFLDENGLILKLTRGMATSADVKAVADGVRLQGASAANLVAVAARV